MKPDKDIMDKLTTQPLFSRELVEIVSKVLTAGDLPKKRAKHKGVTLEKDKLQAPCRPLPRLRVLGEK